MDLGSVMDGLGDRLRTIADLRVYDYPADAVSVPAGVVAFPDLTYDSTMAGAADRASFPVHVAVGKVSDRAARDALALYIAEAGASSIKAAIEGDITLGGAAQTVRVTECTVSRLTIGGVDYLAATFTVDVVA